MATRDLGRSGISVSWIILGCGNLGGVGSALASCGLGIPREEAPLHHGRPSSPVCLAHAHARWSTRRLSTPVSVFVGPGPGSGRAPLEQGSLNNRGVVVRSVGHLAFGLDYTWLRIEERELEAGRLN